MRVVASIVVCAALCACRDAASSTAAKPAPLSAAAVRGAAATLVLCRTTEDELRTELGAPYRDGRIAAGRVLTWMPAGDKESWHYLGVLVREDKRVIDVYFDAPTEVPWVPADRCPR